MMDWFVAGLASLFMITGSTFSFLAALGVLRFPDLFTRMHAASKAGTVGSGFLLLALATYSGGSSIWIKCFATLLFFIFTAPVSAHLLAKSARKAGALLRNL